MTQDASPRLHVVTGNVVVDTAAADRSAVWPDLCRRAAALDARASAVTSPPRAASLVVAGAGLTVVLALLGRQPWQLPSRDGGGLADVPQSLLPFLLLSAATCLWTAGRLARPAGTLRSPAAARMWWGLVLSAAAVSLTADLSLASFAGTDQRPGDLVVRCALPLVPAVLAGVLAADAGRAARIRMALGTGLVTVPLGTLGWALLSSGEQSAAGLDDVLAMGGLAVLAPLIVGVAFVAADRRGQCSR